MRSAGGVDYADATHLLHHTLTRVSHALSDLILPVQCVGCGKWDAILCERCRAIATNDPGAWQAVEVNEQQMIMAWALGEYAGALRSIVLAAKHRPRVDLSEFLWRCGITLGEHVAREAAWRTLDADEIWVVPAPSRFARRFRGQLVALDVAHGVAVGLLHARVDADDGRSRMRVRVIDAVRLRVGSSSQSGKSGTARAAGRSGSMIRRVDIVPKVNVILVDDVMTTGATVREMAQVLGPSVQAVVTLCRVSATGTPQ